MKICYSPYNEKAMEMNKYIFQVTNAMKLAGFEVVNMDYTLKNLYNYKSVKIFNLNWYENIYDKNEIKALIHFLKKLIIIYILKFSKKKIIWTMHNKIPHDTNNYLYCHKLMKILIKKSDKIIIHSTDSIQEIQKIFYSEKIKGKIVHINHPNYLNIYDITKNDLKEDLNINGDELIILFFGQIKPYKNIELILDVANYFKEKKVKFVIAGKCSTPEYKSSLKKKIVTTNIIPLFRFISNEELLNLINTSDILLLPYNIESSLNSGTVLLAASLSKTVICPNIGTIKDLNSYENIYAYDYNCYKEHKNSIISYINQLLLEKNYKEHLAIKGENLKKIMETDYSVEKISECYKDLLHNLVGGN